MEDVERLIEEGKKLLTKFKASEARKKFEEALKISPDNLEAMVWLGRLELMLENDEKGIEWLDKVLQIAPHYAEALALKGVYALKIGNYAEAISYLEDAKNLDPELDMVYFNLAKAYRKTEQYKKAEVILLELLRKRPNDYKAHYELGTVYARTGRIKEAILETLESIKINPLYLKGYLTLGQVYSRTGFGDIAIKLYLEGLRHNPNALPLREELCRLYALKLDFKSAYEQAQEIVKRRGDYSDYLLLSKYALTMGEFEAAEKALLKATEIDPDRWEAYYNLGEIYLTAKLMKEAFDAYNNAVARCSDNYKPYNGMGLWYMYNDKYEEAKAYFLRALEIMPGAIEPTLNMALICAKLEDYESALKFAKAVIRLGMKGDGFVEEAEKLIKAIEKEYKPVTETEDKQQKENTESPEKQQADTKSSEKS